VANQVYDVLRERDLHIVGQGITAFVVLFWYRFVAASGE
jgi:hypothetical protein